LTPSETIFAMNLKKIPATIVTGFLGSGKTTLAAPFVRPRDGRRIAVIVNEFGELGIDGELLAAAPSAASEERSQNGQHVRAGQRLPVLHRAGRILPP
jgi:cobalamin biosynthesis protein CobW